jgi:hypothetical protein
MSNKTRILEFNHRGAIEQTQIDYLAALRDGAFFDNFGIKVQVKIPKIENNLDEYINYIDDDFYVEETVVVPKFKEYRNVLSQLGQSAEEDYPLEIAIPSALHLPRNSRIILNEYNANENRTAREWRVLSTELKQISNSKTYSKIAYCVPARSNIFITSKVGSCQCYVMIESEVSDYEILPGQSAYICNMGKCYPVDNNRNTSAAVAECACRVDWRIKLPSILY